MAVLDLTTDQLVTAAEIANRAGVPRSKVQYQLLRLRIDPVARFGPVRVFSPADTERIIAELVQGGAR